jgi:hypothetical protein
MRLILLSLLAVLAGCATSTKVGNAPDQELATIIGQMDRGEGFFRWRSYALLRVDEVPIRYAFMSNPYDAVARVAPGEHRLVIHASFNTGIGGPGVFQSVIVLPCLLEMGRSYRLNGTVRGNESFVWIEDADTQVRVGEEASAPYLAAPASATIPIFIPAR